MQLVTLCLSVLASGPLSEPQDVPAEGVAVVELFTSEGCSSCPPADRLLARLSERRMENVFLLAYHVTYWDYLGWRDPFGHKSFDERQRRYAQVLGERTYTPQMIVNGSAVFVGSDAGRAREAIEENLRTPAKTRIALDISRPVADKVKVAYALQEATLSVMLHFAVVESGLESRVSRGENAGRTLGHVGVVRGFSSVSGGSKTSGIVEIGVPPELNSATAAVIVWAQEPDSLAIVGAASKALQ